MKTVWLSFLSMALGFVGGLTATKVSSYLIEQPNCDKVGELTVRATRFELVNSAGTPLAYWGEDRLRGEHETPRAQIAFIDRTGQSRAEFGLTTEAGNKGVDYNPFFVFRDSDRNARLEETLDEGGPFLGMGDARGGDRVLLGHWTRGDVVDAPDPDVWSLSFRAPFNQSDYAEIGLTTPLNTHKRTGFVRLYNDSAQKPTEWPK
jgi:hypothetical protein